MTRSGAWRDQWGKPTMGARKRRCHSGWGSGTPGSIAGARPAGSRARTLAPMSGIGGIGGRALAARLGRVGVWSFALQRLTAADAAAAMREYERLGYPAVWMPESVGSKEVFAHAALLLAGSERAIVAPGIASIYA